MRSRLTRYLLTMILPSGLLCLIFVTSLYQEERALFRQNLEAAEALRAKLPAALPRLEQGHPIAPCFAPEPQVGAAQLVRSVIHDDRSPVRSALGDE